MMCLGIVITVEIKLFVEILPESVSKAIHGVEEVLPILSCNLYGARCCGFFGL